MGTSTWSGYDPSDAKLAALYAKGKAHQWDAEHAIDWSLPIDPSAPVHASAFPILELPLFERLSASQRNRVTASFTEHALSQFIHGEQGALMAAAQLVCICPDYEAKVYAATQTVDEARHVEVFSRYVKRCGSIRPVDPALHQFLEGVLEADSWIKVLLGMQIVVEGAALSSFHRYREHTRDPVLADVLDRVIRDEARHVGFGTLYIGQMVRKARPDEREMLADYAFDRVMAFSRTRQASFRASAAVLSEVGIDLDDVLRDAARVVREGNRPRGGDATRDGITDFILPTLKRLGVVTPRFEERLENARIVPTTGSALLDQLDALLLDSEVRP